MNINFENEYLDTIYNKKKKLNVKTENFITVRCA